MRFDPANPSHVALARDAGYQAWLLYRPVVARTVEVLAAAGIDADPESDFWLIATARIPPVASRLKERT